MDTSETPIKERKIGFLDLPVKIRNKIYRFTLVYPDNIRCSYREDSRGSDLLRLKPQLLRTSHQVYSEGMPFLYGENTFEFKISNTYGPHYSSTTYPARSALGAFFGDRPSWMQNPRREGEFIKVVQPLLRRFSFVIRYTEDHEIAPLREGVTKISRWLQNSIPEDIDFFELDCDLECTNEDSSINWRDPCWDDYEPAGTIEECSHMIAARLGEALGGRVKEVAGKSSGLLSDDDIFLRERLPWRPPREDNKTETTGTPAAEKTSPSDPPTTPPSGPGALLPEPEQQTVQQALLDWDEQVSRRSRRWLQLRPETIREAHLIAECGDMAYALRLTEGVVKEAREIVNMFERDIVLLQEHQNRGKLN